jgi:hypothetical protein
VKLPASVPPPPHLFQRVFCVKSICSSILELFYSLRFLTSLDQYYMSFNPGFIPSTRVQQRLKRLTSGDLSSPFTKLTFASGKKNWANSSHICHLYQKKLNFTSIKVKMKHRMQCHLSSMYWYTTYIVFWQPSNHPRIYCYQDRITTGLQSWCNLHNGTAQGKFFLMNCYARTQHLRITVSLT